jgi:hypothetical protein
MQPSDRKAFVEIVIGFAELKGKQLSAPALSLFWNAMQHWSIEDFRAAANHLVGTCQFMPTPKDFEDLRRAHRPTADEAWLAARKSLQWTVSGYVEKPGIDPMVSKALRTIGGANALAMCEENKLHFMERRFSEAYEALQGSGDVRIALPKLAPLQVVIPRLTG